MGRQNDYGYGILTNTDVENLEKSLSMLIDQFGKEEKLNILEIGTYEGNTMRSVRKKVESLGNPNCEYWSVDDGSYMKNKVSPFPECHFILGDSTESFMLVPEKLHWVFIDGCHCANHSMLDFLNYGYRVIKNGFVVFHDAGNSAQGRGWQRHGPQNHLDFETAVLSGFKKMNIMNRPDWKHISTSQNPRSGYGGVAIFQKVLNND